MKQLSSTMDDALNKTIECDGLIRRPGGFWTGENTSMLPWDTSSAGIHYKNEPTTIPTWYFESGTINALVKRGILKGTRFMRRGDAYFVEFALFVKSVYKMPNGMIATFATNNMQIGELQGEYSTELHKKILKYSSLGTEWKGFKNPLNPGNEI